jgi:tripartite ATP-independent transporter DctP family solute receptor
MSGMTALKSRNWPCASIKPGFSRPTGPKRTSFMNAPVFLVAWMIGLVFDTLGYGFMPMSAGLRRRYGASKIPSFSVSESFVMQHLFRRPVRALALGLMCWVALSAMAAQKLKWAHVYETTEAFHTESVWAAEEIKKRSNGKFDIQVFPASSLGKETDLNQGLTLGTVDIIISGASFAARTYPRFGIAYYPFIFRDSDHLLAFSKSTLFQEMTQEFRRKTGIQVTAYAYYGARQTTGQKVFNTCADIKGLKIRVPDAPAYITTWQACGANPTPIAFAEVYLALQNGTVDAQENPLTAIEAKKFYEVQKTIMLTSHVVEGLITMVGPHVWNTLSPAEQQIFTEVMQEASARITTKIKKREAELIEFFKSKGLKVVNVDRKSFQDTVLKNKPVASLGQTRADYDRIQAVK